MLINSKMMSVLALSVSSLAIPLSIGCSHSHHEHKGGTESTMSPIAKTVENSGFKEEKKAEKKAD